MIKQIIHNAIKELDTDISDIGNEVKILNILDSMDFVNLVILVEEKIFNETGKQITLVNDKAYSMRHNPFETIETMTEYIEGIL